MLPLMLAGGGALLSAKQAQDQKQANRMGSDRDALMASLQTAYSGINGGPAGQLSAQAADPSVMGNALAGGVAGFSQGQAFGQADTQDKVNNAYAQMLQKQQPMAPNRLALPQRADRAGGLTAYSQDYLTRA